MRYDLEDVLHVPTFRQHGNRDDPFDAGSRLIYFPEQCQIFLAPLFRGVLLAACAISGLNPPFGFVPAWYAGGYPDRFLFCVLPVDFLFGSKEFNQLIPYFHTESNILRNDYRDWFELIAVCLLVFLMEGVGFLPVVSFISFLQLVIRLFDDLILNSLLQAVAVDHVREILVVNVGCPRHVDDVTKSIVGVLQKLHPLLQTLLWGAEEMMRFVVQHQRPFALTTKTVRDG